MNIQLRKIQNGFILSAIAQSERDAEEYGVGYDRRGYKLKPIEVYCKDKNEVAAATQKLLEGKMGESTTTKKGK